MGEHYLLLGQRDKKSQVLKNCNLSHEKLYQFRIRLCRRRPPPRLPSSQVGYWVILVVTDLGWGDFDFECSTVCPTVPGLVVGIRLKLLGNKARWWNKKIQVNPTRDRDHQCRPVLVSILWQSIFKWPLRLLVASEVTSDLKFELFCRKNIGYHWP